MPLKGLSPSDGSLATAVRRTTLEPAIDRWRELDSDWQSVAFAFGTVGLIVAFDVPVPG